MYIYCIYKDLTSLPQTVDCLYEHIMYYIMYMFKTSVHMYNKFSLHISKHSQKNLQMILVIDSQLLSLALVRKQERYGRNHERREMFRIKKCSILISYLQSTPPSPQKKNINLHVDFCEYIHIS